MHVFTHNTMSSLLHLQGIIVYKVTEKEERFEIKIGQPRKPTKCLYCSSSYRESLCKSEARERWQHVLTLMPEVAKRTLKEKLEEILNYFDNKTTSGFTEGVHTKVKLLKRLSYGLRNPQSYVEKLELGFVEPKLLISNHTN